MSGMNLRVRTDHQLVYGARISQHKAANAREYVVHRKSSLGDIAERCFVDHRDLSSVHEGHL